MSAAEVMTCPACEKRTLEPTKHRGQDIMECLVCGERTDLDGVILTEPETNVEVEPEPETDAEDGKKTQAVKIIEYVRSKYRIIRADDGKLYVVPLVGPRIVTGLTALAARISSDMYEDLGITLSESAQRQAMGVLRGDAIQADETPVFLRAAYIDAEKSVYIDLGDRERTIVRVDKDGWRFTDPNGEGPVFRRSDATQTLPMPVQGVDADEVRGEYARLLGWDVDSDEFLLTWGWLVGAWFADIPRPMLWATGGPGSGKSTRTRMILGLVDPAGELSEPPGRNSRDDSTKAAARFVPTFDNVAAISAATSDWICRLVTGVSVESRALYTDDDVRANIIKRAGLATSVNLPYGLGPDALERLLVLRFEPVAKRMLERTLERQEQELAPRAFSALLSDLSGALGRLDEVPEDAEFVRMADYHATLMALDLHHGGGRHAEVYEKTVNSALVDRVEDDPFLTAVVELAKRAEDEAYWATPATLVHDIEVYLQETEPERDSGSLKLPSERGIRAALQNAAQPLAEVGVRIDPKVKRLVGGQSRYGIRLTYTEA